MQTKILKTKSIIKEDKLYPRTKCDWFTVNDYANSMKAGAKFPPIDVALFGKKYYLIDGLHRIKAVEQLKEEHIQANIHTGLSKQKIFVMAVKFNIAHGRPMSAQDKAMVIDRLEKFKFSVEEISKMVNIPLDKFEKFKFNKITNTVTGGNIYLKGTVKNFAGISVQDNFNELQDNFSTRGQITLLQQTIDLIENGLVDFKNPHVMQLLSKLKDLINSIKPK